MYYKTNTASPLGNIILASSEKGLIGLWMEGQKYACKTLPKEAIEEKADFPILVAAKKWLCDYFDGRFPKIGDLPLDPIGTAFQKKVWDILKQIPYGSVVTYRAIADQIAKETDGKKMSAQAVGGEVGHNQISIIIPCHRVVGSSGSLTGYAGGLDKKIKLLTHEGVDMTKLFIPKKGTAL